MIVWKRGGKCYAQTFLKMLSVRGQACRCQQLPRARWVQRASPGTGFGLQSW